MRVEKFALAAVLLLISAAATAAEPGTRVVHVSGQGLVQAPPDQVVIDMTVTTVDDDLLRVRESNDKDVRAILANAKKYGAKEDGFRVSRMELHLEYNEQLRRQIYNLERDVAVELGDLSKFDHLLLDLLHEPNLKVKDISFSTANARQLESDALKKAVADARDKAQFLAGLNGLKLGKARDIRVQAESQTPFVISVIPVVGSSKKKAPQRSDARHSSPLPDPFGRAKAPLGGGFFCVASEGADQAGDTRGQAATGKPFALGLIDTTARVEIDFEMKE